ncbi:MAG: rhomboid family intramembrane serine protease [Rhodovibrionaceae bacterium]|nr:rhomboid family intramembrane serine protease [Rhodovibrionaceae bacterium]
MSDDRTTTGQRRSDPVAEAYRNPPKTPMLLIGVMAGIFAIEAMLPQGLERRLLAFLAFGLFETWDEALLRVHTLVTHAFLHANLPHLFFNALAIFTAGSVACRILGSARFLLLCLIAAVAGASTHAALNWGELFALRGASGIAFGLWGAASYFWIYRPHERPARRVAKVVYWVAIMMLLNVIYAFAAGGPGGVFGVMGRISWEAHAGGFLAGLIAFPILRATVKRQ